MTKLTKDQKAEITQRYAKGEKATALGAEFGLCENYASQIALANGAPRLGKAARTRIRAEQRERPQSRQIHSGGKDTSGGAGCDEVGQMVRNMEPACS